MTDAVQPPLPPAPPSGAARILDGAAEPNARVLSVTGDLQTTAEPQSLIGRVISQSGPDTVEITTPSGNVTARLLDRRTPVQTGDRVEVEIPAGSPPRSVKITPQPEAQPQPQTEPPPAAGQPQSSSPPPANTGGTSTVTKETVKQPPRSVSTPVEIDIKPKTPGAPPTEPPPDNAAPTAPPKPPAPEIPPARLEPLSAQQAISLIESTLQIVLTAKLGIITPPIAIDSLPAPETRAVPAALPITTEAPALPAPDISLTPLLTPPAITIANPPTIFSNQTPALAQPSTPLILQTPGAPFQETQTPFADDSIFAPAPLLTITTSSPIQPAVTAAAPATIKTSPAKTLLQTFFSKPQTIQTQTPAPTTNTAEAPSILKLSGVAPPLLPTPAAAASLQTLAETGAALPNYALLQPGPIENGGIVLQAPEIAAAAATPNTPLQPQIKAPQQDSTPALIENIIQNAKPDSSAPSLILKPVKAGEQSATVIGTTAQSLPVIALWPSASAETPEFMLAHMPLPGIASGTELALIPASSHSSFTLPSAVTSPLSAPILPFPIGISAEPWPLMDELYQTLQQIAPQAARAMLAMTPSPANPANIGAAALFFIAALRSGDLTQLIGDRAVDALKRAGRAGLLSRLGQEGAALSKTAADSTAQEWRQTAMPMAWDQQIQKILIHYRSEDQSQKEQSDGKQTRFIFDLNFNRLGPVQIDGLFRDKRMDLIVRTNAALSPVMQSRMKALYAEAMINSNLTGELGFQHHPDQWVTFTKPPQMMGVSV